MDTDDVAEGATNLYFTDARVTASPAVVLNTAKVSADGPVSTHSDVDTTGVALGDRLQFDGSEWVPSVVDTRFEHIFDDTETTTTSTVFQNYFTLTTPATNEAGTYKIVISYIWNHDSTTSDFEGRVVLDGDTANPITFHKQEPKDSAGGDPSGTTQRYGYTQVVEVIVAAGSHTYDFEFRTDNGANESTVFQAFLYSKRIG